MKNACFPVASNGSRRAWHHISVPICRALFACATAFSAFAALSSASAENNAPTTSFWQDPLASEQQLPLRISPQMMLRSGEAPCRNTLPEGPLTVLDAVDLALCNNPETHALWAAARVQAAQLGSARAAYLPTLDASLAASQTRQGGSNTSSYTSRSRSAGVNFSWLLYDFGRREASTENAQWLLEAAALTQDAGAQTLFLSAVSAYYTAQANRAAVVSTLEAERAAEESYNAAQTRYTVGVGTPADRLQAKTAWSQATLNRIQAEGSAKNALGTLANVMGINNAAIPIVLADVHPSPNPRQFTADVDALIARALEQRADLRAAQARLQAAQANIDLARAQARPSINLSARQSWSSQNTDNGGVLHSTPNSGTVGITVTIPLFTGWNTHYQVRAAEAQKAQQAAQLDTLANQVALDVWQSYQSLITAGQSLAATADLLASARQSAEVALGRYKAGVGSVLDVLSAQSAHANARMQHIQSQLNWHVYRATLAKNAGQLDYRLLQQPASSQ